MNSGKFKAVILAGGSGERFWPLSTSKRPKQFLRVFGGESLIRQTVARLGGFARACDTFVVTTRGLVALTRRELGEIPPANVIGEPMRRDTCAALALGVSQAAAEGEDDVVGFFPSDHMVRRPQAFRRTLAKAIALARREDAIVTIGIRPDRPSTAFGYISPKTRRFVEKPDEATAKRYVKAGYLWNAGMFIARASVFRAAFAAHAPALCGLARLRGVRGLAAAYRGLPRISFDYAVMEHASNIEVVPGDFGWDDVGGYDAFDRYFPHDAQGNVREGDCTLVDSAGNVCVSPCARVALLGVRDLVVVATRDGVLVAAKSKLGGMKRLFG